MSKVGIVGAGLIGRAWANVFARAGWNVRVWDPDMKQRSEAVRLVTQSLHELAAHGLVQEPEVAAARVTIVPTLEEAVADANYVQESGPEVLEVKRATFEQLDRAAPPEAVLASSTSAIVASLFTAGLAGRARCLVAHPVNPPHLVPVVEVCGAPWTSAETKARARYILESVGQVPIDVKREIDGFILNRLQVALLTEAFRLVQEGYVSPEDLDHTIADGLGLRWAFMGPFETIELNAPGGIPDYCARYSDTLLKLSSTPVTPAVWGKDNVGRAVESWGRNPGKDEIAGKSRWRDERIAALVAHKKRQPQS
jgi:3-hydroxyacyl-CoA dehydrogenase